MAEAVRRSWLLVPASDEEAVRQASGCGADVVVLDLVELVHDRAKPDARSKVAGAIAAAGGTGAEVFVQVDRELLHADLEASIWPGLTGVIVSRSESRQDVLEADSLLADLEDRRGLQSNALEIVASLETAAGNYNAYDVATASARVWGVTLGRADLVMDLRPEPSGEIHLMPYLMQRLITVATAARVTPLGAWWRPPARGLLAGPDETYEAAFRGRRLGFRGSLCLHPNQVQPLNRGFAPGQDDVEEATRLIELFRSTEANGAAALRVEDRILDMSMVAHARQLLARAEACAAKDEAKSNAQARAAS